MLNYIVPFFILLLAVVLTRYFTIKNIDKRLILRNEHEFNYRTQTTKTNLIYLFLLNVVGWLALLLLVSEKVLYVY
jgi:hypothetical protein